MSATWTSASSDENQSGTNVDTVAMEARIRLLVVESRRKRNPSGQSKPCLKSNGESPTPPAAHLLPCHPRQSGGTTPAGNPSSQNILSLLAAQQKLLAEEIAIAKAQLENLKPKSTMDKRMRRRELWPESNLQALVIDISDDEEDDNCVYITGGSVLGAITNHS